MKYGRAPSFLVLGSNPCCHILMKKRIAILTGGGDAPGLNGIIESIVRTMSRAGWEVIGICDGFEGIFERRHKILRPEDIEGAHSQAGTILGTSNKSFIRGREKEFTDKYQELGCEGLIAAGGDGTFSSLSRLGSAVKLLGVPKTIDNDLEGTDITFGYDTACSVIAESVDALRATADAHRRVIVVETMGRTAGWIALGGGLASFAEAILIPERPFSRLQLRDFLQDLKSRGRRGAVVVVSEGAMAMNEEATVAFRVDGAPQAERYGGVAQGLARWIEQEVDWESRHVVPGHLQRSRAPTTTDRFLTLAMGVEVARMAIEGRWGNAAVYRGGVVTRAPLSDLMKPARLVPTDHRWVQLAQGLGIFV